MLENVYFLKNIPVDSLDNDTNVMFVLPDEYTRLNNFIFI